MSCMTQDQNWMKIDFFLLLLFAPPHSLIHFHYMFVDCQHRHERKFSFAHIQHTFFSLFLYSFFFSVFAGYRLIISSGSRIERFTRKVISLSQHFHGNRFSSLGNHTVSRYEHIRRWVIVERIGNDWRYTKMWEKRGDKLTPNYLRFLRLFFNSQPPHI